MRIRPAILTLQTFVSFDFPIRAVSRCLSRCGGERENNMAYMLILSVAFLLVFMIFMMITRWIFRIDEQIRLLTDIRNCLNCLKENRGNGAMENVK